MENAQKNNVGSNSNAFHRFRWLPAELRRLIWLQHLGEAASSPTIYRFKILHTVSTFPKIEDGAYRQVATAEDDVFLAPMATLEYKYLDIEDNRFYWDNLVRSTRANRAALAACPESRQIAVGLLPDAIPFRKLTRTGSRDLVEWTRGCVDINHARSLPEYLLRFNRNRDIIVFDTTWYDEEVMMQLSRFVDNENGAAPRRWTKVFSQLRRVGLSMESFARGATGGYHEFSYGVCRTEHCGCATDACRDSCRLDPLPGFLTSIFPELETFYIAQVAGVLDDNPKDNYEPFVPLRDADCKCAAAASAKEDPGETGTNQPGRHHVWPSFRSADIDRLCACWDEQTGCLSPYSMLLDWIRREWRPQFPYYQKLEHLDIRFLRRLDPVGDPRSNFPEWLELA
ncbi:hypothetical protein MAPG_00944 [Magnaporthiopsis poae ATCC 64411]|uniref:2EXR domain-containing protein n=1 Tax=Magnaporthiopsis poae (strain ATCC 64411 / 73-15) TaxID=644358 RepID=A0A0C4DMD8_MAGP6|nr:hypothetical protein MAPG_00944 [Magnaporthiopsis poae ATCC 64411]